MGIAGARDRGRDRHGAGGARRLRHARRARRGQQLGRHGGHRRPRTHERLTRLNIVPDLAERRAEILGDPAATGFFAAADDSAPRITRARVIAGALRLRLSEEAKLRIVVQRARAGRWRTLRVVRREAAAGNRRFGLGRLRAAGRHRLSITAADEAGNRSPRRIVRFRVRGSAR